MRHRRLFAVLLLLFGSSLHASNLVQFTTIGQTDFAMFGVAGMRGQGTGTINVSGISGSVTRAVLYWQGPTEGSDANATVTFNGTNITGTALGVSSHNCWSPPFVDSRGFRADVTSLVSGNGSYALTNFFSAAPPSADTNGATLLVFYNDGNAANNRDIVIFNGNDSNQSNAFDAAGWNATLNGVNYTSGTATLRLIVSDGQAFVDNGVALNSTTILASGSNFEGDTLPDAGTAAVTNGGLWDHRSFNVTSLLTPGNNNLVLTSTAGGSDCLSLIGAIFDLPAGAAPAANVGVTKTAPPSVTLGGDIMYTISVNNAGPQAATNVVVTDALPAGLTLVSATATPGSCSGTSTVACTVPSLANGASATIAIRARPGTTGTVTNTATVTANEPDSVLANNSSAASTIVAPAAANAQIPTVSQWGLMMLLAGLLAAAALRIH